MSGGAVACRVQPVPEHERPLQLRFDPGMAQAACRLLFRHIVMAEGIQREMAEEPVYIGPVCQAVRMHLQHPGGPLKKIPARTVMEFMTQPAHRIFREGLIVKEQIRAVQTDGIELGIACNGLQRLRRKQPGGFPSQTKVCVCRWQSEISPFRRQMPPGNNSLGSWYRGAAHQSPPTGNTLAAVCVP